MRVFESISFSPIGFKDFSLGFLLALALRRGRLRLLLDKVLPDDGQP